ncbi:MAG TPA: serine protease [Vicinamibacterales bacterium]|nr:serine protease [Vicinamibacterales bacterium]
MFRALVIATLIISTGAWQDDGPRILQIRIVLPDADGRLTPVPRHRLLISDNPVTASPRLVITDLDGTATVRLRPGSYTVESDLAVALHGKSYSWTEQVTVAAGKDASLELTAENAQVEAAAGSTTGSAPATGSDAAFFLRKWQDSVVALWTPTTRGSGFVIDANGLIVTNQRIVGDAKSVEVQFTPQLKVAGSVLAADAERDVAVIWIAATTIAELRPVPLPCNPGARTAIENGQELFALGASLQPPKRMSSGIVSRVDSHSIMLDLGIARGSAGGPVFSSGGDLVGITTVTGQDDGDALGGTRVVHSGHACDVVAAAKQKMSAAAPPASTPLPVEPGRPFPVSALKAAAERRAGSLNPYQIQASGFDVAFITPVLTYGAQYQFEQMRRRRTTSKDTRTAQPDPPTRRAIMDFANWSEYVWEFPPVLLVRVTPRMAEGFWTTVARAAARTQGVALPPMKRYKPGFSRMQVFCGSADVTPIHPFKLERRISESDAIFEGLYVLDPGALGPHCGAVKLVLFSEDEPEKGDTQVVDQRVIQQIWDDFAPYRR